MIAVGHVSRQEAETEVPRLAARQRHVAFGAVAGIAASIAEVDNVAAIIASAMEQQAAATNDIARTVAGGAGR